ncbi:hypothetical protein ACQR1W_03850 [Bradyrhizobium sp. HKCCYLS1011]|uniref:hypothetical protein n=1 Tax=Bradyrhizobium sp. HKCCYLS1011 TaxID=3420733 RepID=UPI003EC0DE43
MKWRGWVAGLVVACGVVPLALAQSGLDTPANAPRLSDMMTRIQVRHAKLWFAGQAQNWPLAAYELSQLKTALAEAAVLYTGIPVSNVTTMMTPIQAISDSIDAKDNKRFAKAVGDLTDGCNACHGSMERSFVMIRVPTENPFSNQVFRQSGKR